MKLWSIQPLHWYFLKILLISVQTFMTSVGRVGRKSHVFTYSIVFKQKIYFLFLRIGLEGIGLWEGGPGGYGRDNCMTLNMKTCFDKNITLLDLVPVLRWNSHPRFLIYVRSKWKVPDNIVNLQEWHQDIRDYKLYSNKYYCGKKTKNLPRQPHLVCDRFIEVFYKCFLKENVWRKDN